MFYIIAFFTCYLIAFCVNHLQHSTFSETEMKMDEEDKDADEVIHQLIGNSKQLWVTYI